MRENEEWIGLVRERSKAMGDTKDDVVELLDMIERGFDDIEHRISNMDKEHTKYVRATVTRLNYLLSGETDTKGLVVQLLNQMSAAVAEEQNTQVENRGNGYSYEEMLQLTGERMNMSLLEMLSEKSLYKRRKPREDFISQMAEDETIEDLNREDVLKLNRILQRYSKQEIEAFIEEHMKDDVMDVEKLKIADEESFEKLILAYDYSTRRNSKYIVLEEDTPQIENGCYKYPALKFVRRGI